MDGRSVSGVVSPPLFDLAQTVSDDEGTTVSALVSAAVSLYLGLPASARRSARYLLAAATADELKLVLENCGHAIAQAADRCLAAQLAAHGKEMGMQTPDWSDEAIEAEAVAAVAAHRSASRGAARNLNDPPPPARSRSVR
jgi:hypothetical protein